jgi:hypothetical protein
MQQGKAATPNQREAFLRLLRKATSVSDAAAAVGVNRRTAYRWRQKDETLRDEWDDATETITENIESALARNALAGDTVSQIFWLKAHKPELYNRKMMFAVGGDPDAPPVGIADQTTPGQVVIQLPHNFREELQPGVIVQYAEPPMIEAEPVAETKPEVKPVDTSGWTRGR